MKLYNFFVTILIFVFSSYHSQVKISEVYFDSFFNEVYSNGEHHYGEFIEFYNRSSQDIDISGWMLYDNYAGYSFPQGTIIKAKNYIVLANGMNLNSSYINNFTTLFPQTSGYEPKIIYQTNIQLGNDEDLLILKDKTGNVVDDIHYKTTPNTQYGINITASACFNSNINNNSAGAIPSTDLVISPENSISLQRNNFDTNSIVQEEATPFSLIFVDVYNSGGGNPPNSVGTGFSNDNYVYTRTYLEPTTASSDTKKQIQEITYFDGLGRPKQSIAIKATPKGNDLVTPIVYDGFGREVDSYLPVSMASTNGAIQSLDPSGVINYYSSPRNTTTKDFDLTDIKPFSHKELELSPLDRINKQYQVGNDWSTKPVNFGYDANGTGEVKKFIATFNYSTFTSSLSIAIASDYVDNNGFYKENQLYKNTVTDEDGNASIEFKNGQGQTLLVRKMLGTTPVDTYYVYNDYDQLAFVIPPLAADKYKGTSYTAGTSILMTDTDLNQLCYQYKYDTQNRLVEKKLPGKGWEYMVYDKQDRLVATQDFNLKQGVSGNTNLPGNQWLYTKYDQFGRVVYTGIKNIIKTRTEYQSDVDLKGSNNEERNTTGFDNSTLKIYYSNNAYPDVTTTDKVLSVNYYDEYPAGSPVMPATIESQTVNSITPQSSPNNANSKISIKGLPVASFVKNIEDNGWTKTYTYYDLKARPISTYSVNYLGGYTRTATKLKFSGKPEYTLTYHKKADRSDVTTIKETFEYDNQERLVKHWHQVNNTGNNELLAENIYNEIGQLQTKKVGGNTSAPLQTVDYGYNIRGWMTQINNPANLGDDLFGYKIKYNQVDGLQIPNSDYQNDKVLPKYNGNIAEIDWVTGTEYDPIQKRFGYVYDGLNRLVAGYYQPENNNSGKEYFERLQYDVNGNVTELKRSGRIEAGYNTANLIDNLGYTYTGNQLTKVVDTSGKADGYPSLVTHNTITYDANGNMTKHLDKNISSISYNFLNLPNQITQTTNTSYVYRADGLKLKKLYGGKKTDYLDGFQYENDVLQFVPTAEGYYDFNLKNYIYNFTDHLGNVRLSYSDEDKNGIIDVNVERSNSGCFQSGTLPNGIPIMECTQDIYNYTEILEENNYYPFGLKHEGYNSLSGNQSYQYKYQGQELQETGFYSFKWREYMPELGRFIQIDPLSAKYPYNSTYAFQENKMGLGRELEGLELVQDYRHAPKTSVIVTVKPQTKVKQLYGDKSNWYSFANVYSQLTGNAPNNLSVTTTQSVTTFIYKKGGKTVSSKSDADYLVVNKQETIYKNDFASLSTLADVSFSEKKTTNTYEDYTVKNGKVSLVNITPSSQVSETLVNLPDTPSSHQKAVVKANNENTADSANQMVDYMKQNVSNNANNQMNSMEIPKKELERVPEQVKQSW